MKRRLFSLAAAVRSSGGWRRAWLICGLASLCLLVTCAITDRQRALALRARQAAEAAANGRFLAARDQFRKEEATHPLYVPDERLGPGASKRPMNRDELAARLFPNGAPTSRPTTVPNCIGWPDTERGIVWWFVFRDDGTWSNMSMSSISPPIPGKPRIVAWREQLEPLRRLWVGSFTGLTAGTILWVVFLIASLPRGDAQPHFAHATLLVAWLCFLGWLLNPNYPISLRGIFSNDMLFWGTLMLLVSTFVFAKRVRPKADSGLCPTCGYDLRATPDRCPECGAIPNPSKVSA